MKLKEFNKLTQKDFENGTVLDEIRKSLEELESLKIAQKEFADWFKNSIYYNLI